LHEIANGGYDDFTVFSRRWDFRHLEHVGEEVLEIGDGVGEVDCFVNAPDYGLVGGDERADDGCEVVGTAAAEDADDFFPVADGEDE